MQYIHGHIVAVPSDSFVAYPSQMGARAWSAAGLAVILAAGCTSSPWQAVPLPDGLEPASLAATAEGVLVGGKAGTGPALLRVTGTTPWESLDLRPAEPAAAEAALISVSVARDEVSAIGRVFGGAHSNPRLTIWDGTDPPGTLTSRPQEFFTFGGHDAGPLLGILDVAGEPVIVGSRATTEGGEAVLWTRTGTTWEKHAGLGAAVQSDARRVLGFAAAAQAGTQVLIGGDEVSLAGELQQRPAVWLGSVSGSWQQLTPAVPSALAPVGGQLSRVTSLACSQLDNCWAAGWTAGRPVAWSVDAAGATVGDPELLPGDAPRDGDPEALVTMLGETPPG